MTPDLRDIQPGPFPPQSDVGLLYSPIPRADGPSTHASNVEPNVSVPYRPHPIIQVPSSMPVPAAPKALKHKVNYRGRQIIDRWLDENCTRPGRRRADKHKYTQLRDAVVKQVQEAGNEWFRHSNLRGFIGERKRKTNREAKLLSANAPPHSFSVPSFATPSPALTSPSTISTSYTNMHPEEEEMLFGRIPIETRKHLHWLFRANTGEPTLPYWAYKYNIGVQDIKSYFDYLSANSVNLFPNISKDDQALIQGLFQGWPDADHQMLRIWSGRTGIPVQDIKAYIIHLQETTYTITQPAQHTQDQIQPTASSHSSTIPMPSPHRLSVEEPYPQHEKTARFMPTIIPPTSIDQEPATDSPRTSTSPAASDAVNGSGAKEENGFEKVKLERSLSPTIPFQFFHHPLTISTHTHAESRIGHMSQAHIEQALVLPVQGEFSREGNRRPSSQAQLHIGSELDSPPSPNLFIKTGSPPIDAHDRDHREEGEKGEQQAAIDSRESSTRPGFRHEREVLSAHTNTSGDLGVERAHPPADVTLKVDPNITSSSRGTTVVCSPTVERLGRTIGNIQDVMEIVGIVKEGMAGIEEAKPIHPFTSSVVDPTLGLGDFERDNDLKKIKTEHEEGTVLKPSTEMHPLRRRASIDTEMRSEKQDAKAGVTALMPVPKTYAELLEWIKENEGPLDVLLEFGKQLKASRVDMSQ